MEIKYNRTSKGIEVQVGKAHLPGYFLSVIMAKKAADKYVAEIKADAKKRSKKKAD